MNKTLVIMLVDDDNTDLFIQGEVIKKNPLVSKTLSFNFAADALNYLSENEASHWPDFILLDIHMPVMNGFDFLIQFQKFPAHSRSKCKVILLSSSLDIDDLHKAKTNPDIFEFVEKPLYSDKLNKLLSGLS